MPVLQVIAVATRQNRLGPAVAEWFLHRARLHGRFTVDPIDLATVNLPMFDEPRHPRLGQYEHEHTKQWSMSVARADAFVPEETQATAATVMLDELLRWEGALATLRR